MYLNCFCREVSFPAGRSFEPFRCTEDMILLRTAFPQHLSSCCPWLLLYFEKDVSFSRLVSLVSHEHPNTFIRKVNSDILQFSKDRNLILQPNGSQPLSAHAVRNSSEVPSVMQSGSQCEECTQKLSLRAQ